MLIRYLIVINYVWLTDAKDDVTNIMTAEGYRNEVHSLTTKDLYILNLHRIPTSKPTSKIVIIMHGMLASSISYILTGPGIPKADSIAFKLADSGFDVWLANARGTEFSKNHQRTLPTSSEYWKFSFAEIAKYDLPAIIDYVLMKTNHTALHYIGHSQGTTIVMAMLSMFPQYNKKLKTLHLMAPSVYFKNAGILMKTAAMLSEPLEKALVAVGMVETPAISMELRKLTGYLCSSKSVTTLEICKQLLYTSVGPSYHVNEAFFAYPTITNVLRNIPNSISVMQIVHYVQLIRSGGGTCAILTNSEFIIFCFKSSSKDKFLQYNHKTENNLVVYNQSTPPEYQLSNVKTKIHFLYGTTDYITNYQDVERLIREFKPWTIGISKLNGYNHLDFLIAKNVNELVNTKILDLINRYNN